MKQCSRCGETKEFSEFYKDKRWKSGLYSSCKKCVIKWQIKWQINNPEKARKWRKKQRREKPKFRLDNNVSRAIGNCLNGNKNGWKWETLVGYTLQDLTQHLEKQFDDKMSWENYSSYWHIDHIVPKSWFPYQTAEEQAFKDCWGLANLQPLEAKVNLSKNNYFIG